MTTERESNLAARDSETAPPDSLAQVHRSGVESLTRIFVARALVRLNRWVSSEKWVSRSLRARTLVFAPHADDEVLGCGGAIVLKARSGAVVHVVIMTDGSASHRQQVSADELVGMRQREALEAAARLGLTADAYHFLDFEDHALEQHHESACARVGELVTRFQPDEVFIPHHRDVLSDHVATNRIVRRALSHHPKAVTILEYPVWLWNTWPWTEGRAISGNRLLRTISLVRDMLALAFGCRASIDVREATTAKLHALAAYSSQMDRLDGRADWPVLADVSRGEFLACFRSDREIFRRRARQ